MSKESFRVYNAVKDADYFIIDSIDDHPQKKYITYEAAEKAAALLAAESGCKTWVLAPVTEIEPQTVLHITPVSVQETNDFIPAESPEKIDLSEEKYQPLDEKAKL